MMILQSSHHVVDCPICGRPLEMQSQLVSHEIACGHCRGDFIVYETDDGSLATANLKGTDPLKRAEQLLRVASDTEASISEHRCQQRFPLVSVSDDKRYQDHCHDTLLEDAECEDEPQPTALLVEHRDEVFARLAADMAEFGMRVVRAKSETEALKLYDTYELALLVANVDLPDQSGWLLTAKLRLFDRRIRVWLYQRQPSNYGHGIAEFLNVDALLADQVDLFGLSETIVDLMGSRRESHGGADDIDRAEEPTAA